MLVSLVALTVGLPTAIATAIFYVAFRMTEDYLIQPKAMRYSVELPGVITVPAVLVGGAILGIPGALFAVPVALVVRVSSAIWPCPPSTAAEGLTRNGPAPRDRQRRRCPIALLQGRDRLCGCGRQDYDRNVGAPNYHHQSAVRCNATDRRFADGA